MAKKVAIYARVSTIEQHPEKQVDELVEYATQRKMEVYDIYKDTITGISTSTRPALNYLLSDARHNKFDTVLVWKLDRVGRSLKHLLQVVEEWDNLGINFICMTQNIDTTTSSGKLIFHVLGAVAEFEHNLISERTKLGQKRSNKPVGRPKGSKDKKVRRKSGYYQRWTKQ